MIFIIWEFHCAIITLTSQNWSKKWFWWSCVAMTPYCLKAVETHVGMKSIWSTLKRMNLQYRPNLLPLHPEIVAMNNQRPRNFRNSPKSMGFASSFCKLEFVATITIPHYALGWKNRNASRNVKDSALSLDIPINFGFTFWATSCFPIIYSLELSKLCKILYCFALLRFGTLIIESRFWFFIWNAFGHWFIIIISFKHIDLLMAISSAWSISVSHNSMQWLTYIDKA